ncbi:hypothetical protein AB6A40_000051 [Gnathostoma spinigerum]|uniref:Uncharacterized protein n=1 Tax=Gnathostoma spinigerum TaxID=75299 RepID=A0ABD6EA46_9BILA
MKFGTFLLLAALITGHSVGGFYYPFYCCSPYYYPSSYYPYSYSYPYSYGYPYGYPYSYPPYPVVTKATTTTTTTAAPRLPCINGLCPPGFRCTANVCVRI